MGEGGRDETEGERLGGRDGRRDRSESERMGRREE